MKTTHIAALITSTVFLTQLGLAQISGNSPATGTPATSGSGVPTGTVNTNQRTGTELNDPVSSANGRETVADDAPVVTPPPAGCTAAQQHKAKKGSKCYVDPTKKSAKATGEKINPRRVQAGTPTNRGTGTELNRGSGTPNAESVGR